MEAGQRLPLSFCEGCATLNKIQRSKTVVVHLRVSLTDLPDPRTILGERSLASSSSHRDSSSEELGDEEELGAKRQDQTRDSSFLCSCVYVVAEDC
ncbi:Hypothetical predicted protein [Podarcis lilfordi]|uniref:Uncharacterized protein n=1 Tax=Podarcis lilfordi TaxID=74358 RepID=A0AA35L2U6_9SAUR|nr:Hypothetical predicted protein [Podarcis lilfordi]